MSGKRFVSVICEYNPFHFGHKFQMECFKKEFDAVVCIQSGDIVQRGTAAIASKYLRAEAAIKNGANLVLELPMPWCCASARDFARAGVHIADNIGSAFLGFGIEDDLEISLKIQELVSGSNFDQELSFFAEKHKNLSYPALLTEFVSIRLGKDFATAVSKPNNILALEYLLAMKGRAMQPFGVKRNFDFSSSSAIRSLENPNEILSALPEESGAVFSREMLKDFPRDGSRLDSFFIGTLRRMNKFCNNSDFYSVTDDLFNKIFAEAKNSATTDELVLRCTDKIYTTARVRRAINSIVFGITKQRVLAMPTYTTVLAADGIGCEILKSAKKNENFDIITKTARVSEFRDSTKDSFLFSKGIEDIISLSAPIPLSANQGKSPFIAK